MIYAPSRGALSSRGISCRKQGGQPQDGVSHRFWRLGKTTKPNVSANLQGARPEPNPSRLRDARLVRLNAWFGGKTSAG
jgi:hypothetical protein